MNTIPVILIKMKGNRLCDVSETATRTTVFSNISEEPVSVASLVISSQIHASFPTNPTLSPPPLPLLVFNMVPFQVFFIYFFGFIK